MIEDPLPAYREAPMPENTVFTVVHSCGHSLSHDLSPKPPTERAGFARLLAWTPCEICRSADDTEEARRSTEVVRDAHRRLRTAR